MEKISNVEELQRAIQRLEETRVDQHILLKNHFFATCENFKPVNLINHTVKEMINSNDLKTNLTSLAMGGATGILAKEILVGDSGKPLSKLLGVVVELIVSKNVIKNADEIKSFGSNLLDKLLHRNSTPEKTE